VIDYFQGMHVQGHVTRTFTEGSPTCQIADVLGPREKYDEFVWLSYFFVQKQVFARHTRMLNSYRHTDHATCDICRNSRIYAMHAMRTKSNET